VRISYIIFTLLVFCFLRETGLLLKFTPETVRSKKKVGLTLHPSLYLGSRIRDEKIVGTGLGISIPDPQLCSYRY
jgi:hypothetical protein